MRTGTSKGDEFVDFNFKEGNTATVKIQDIFVQEKGRDALRRLGEPVTEGVARVKGAKGKKKAASKSAAKRGGRRAESADIRKSVDKLVKYTPSSKKETPQKAAVSAGKVSAKRSVGGKKQTPAMPSPGGKKSTKTTDQMTMAQFKQYLDWHEKRKGGKAAASGKVLGKRSAGKASAASGKASRASKRSRK